MRLDWLFEPANAVNRNLREGRLSSYCLEGTIVPVPGGGGVSSATSGHYKPCFVALISAVPSAGHGVDSPLHSGAVEEVHEQDQREVVLGWAKGAA